MNADKNILKAVLEVLLVFIVVFVLPLLYNVFGKTLVICSIVAVMLVCILSYAFFEKTGFFIAALILGMILLGIFMMSYYEKQECRQRKKKGKKRK